MLVWLKVTGSFSCFILRYLTICQSVDCECMVRVSQIDVGRALCFVGRNVGRSRNIWPGHRAGGSLFVYSSSIGCRNCRNAAGLPFLVAENILERGTCGRDG